MDHMTSLIKDWKSGDDELCFSAGRKVARHLIVIMFWESVGHENDDLFKKHMHFRVMKAFKTSPFLVDCANKGSR